MILFGLVLELLSVHIVVSGGFTSHKKIALALVSRKCSRFKNTE